MKIVDYCKHTSFITIVFLGIFLMSCSEKSIVPADQLARLKSYIDSENVYIAEMFSDKDVAQCCGVQPALTSAEFGILDVLADKVSPEVRQEFDKRYTAWLNCWAPLDSMPTKADNIRYSLKCSGTEFQNLIDFCKQQDDEIFILLYQLAARAECPYDQLMLHPVVDLIGNFPEFKQYWDDVNLLLESEKPNSENRTCNESTIWCTRKILEKKYGYTYASGLTALFDARKMLLMTQ